MHSPALHESTPRDVKPSRLTCVDAVGVLDLFRVVDARVSLGALEVEVVARLAEHGVQTDVRAADVTAALLFGTLRVVLAEVVTVAAVGARTDRRTLAGLHLCGGGGGGYEVSFIQGTCHRVTRSQGHRWTAALL